MNRQYYHVMINQFIKSLKEDNTNNYTREALKNYITEFKCYCNKKSGGFSINDQKLIDRAETILYNYITATKYCNKR